MVSEESHERHCPPGIGDTDSVGQDSSHSPLLTKSAAMDGKGRGMERRASHSFKCRQTFADYLCTKPVRKPRERRVFTLEGGTTRSHTYQQVGAVQDASIHHEKANETPQREKIAQPARGEAAAGHQQGVQAVRTLLDLQSKQMSKLAICQNRAIETKADSDETVKGRGEICCNRQKRSCLRSNRS